MAQVPPDSRTSWFFKFCESVLAAMALLNLLLFPLLLMPISFFEKYGQYFKYVLIGMVGVTLLGSLIYVWIWHRREKTNSIHSVLQHAWLQGIIRYWLALSISSYGFAKILKTQFETADYDLDMPLGAIKGMGLTWYYFGYSYPLAVIIGLFQIGGSILLLYRRTTLLGATILLPVMVNIVLINVFYNIAIGAFFNSVIYSLSLVFLLLLYGKRLKLIFWDVIDHLPSIPLGRSWIKHGTRILPIALAFVGLKVGISMRSNDQTLKGTWTVEKLMRNGRAQPATAWLTDRKSWSRIYFAGYEECVFSPNPYRFDPSECLGGSYKFDSLDNKLQVAFYSDDTLRATISNRTAETMRLKGILYGDTLDMQLARLHR
ncbi:hypothetical protein [Spirosoma spitsbergense]|uniref:hypothetical protein n=1 Tax=Spirosoma spitsbergense TaxID=431554 RepID=UPI00037E5D57|nr:hypothetical protein [Spirosoma spitsbergense]